MKNGEIFSVFLVLFSIAFLNKDDRIDSTNILSSTYVSYNTPFWEDDGMARSGLEQGG